MGCSVRVGPPPPYASPCSPTSAGKHDYLPARVATLGPHPLALPACEDARMSTGPVKKLAACNLCEAICGLELTIEDGPDGRPHVTSVRGNPDDPLSRGHICPKGVALADVYEDPDRLRTPM